MEIRTTRRIQVRSINPTTWTDGPIRDTYRVALATAGSRFPGRGQPERIIRSVHLPQGSHAQTHHRYALGPAVADIKGSLLSPRRVAEPRPQANRFSVNSCCRVALILQSLNFGLPPDKGPGVLWVGVFCLLLIQLLRGK